MTDLIISIIVVVAWCVFYIAAAVAIENLLGTAACVAFIAFFVGFVLTKVLPTRDNG